MIKFIQYTFVTISLIIAIVLLVEFASFPKDTKIYLFLTLLTISIPAIWFVVKNHKRKKEG